MSEQIDFEPVMSEENVLIINRITRRDAPYSQRAQALLAVNEGKTEEEAAEASGLRATQVKYWVTRYHKSGMAIFPEELLADEVVEGIEIKTAVSSEESTLEQAPSSQKEAKKKKKPKGKKAKEGKGKKQAASIAEEALVDKTGKKKKKAKKEKSAKKTKKDKKSSKKKKEKNAARSKKQKKAKS